MALTLPRWLLLCGLALSSLILAALIRGTPEDVVWYLTHVLPGVLVVIFCTTATGRTVGAVALVAYSLLLPILTLLVGFGVIDPWGDGLRVSLFTANANLLGADLVAVALGAMLVRPRLPWFAWLPVVALAVVFTGSRTALLALCLATAIWIVSPAASGRIRSLAILSAVVFAGILALANWQIREEAQLPNLLNISKTFDHYRWQNFGRAVVTVQRQKSSGPFSRSTAERISTQSDEHTLVLLQFIGEAEVGTPYVASVYLRADFPHEVVLSTVYSTVTCAVDKVWERCVTPSGFGNTQHRMQFRLEKPTRDAPFDVYAYGPQFERGDAATAYTARGNTLIPEELMLRVGSRISQGWTDDVRITAMNVYLEQALRSPWLGSGTELALPVPAATELQDSASSVDHAHNLFVARFAADGIVGLIAWSLMLGPLLVARFRISGSATIPWLVGLAVLNAFDLTLLHSGSYFSGAIVLALSLGREPQTQQATLGTALVDETQ